MYKSDEKTRQPNRRLGRRFLSLLLTAVMLLGLSLPASAAGAEDRVELVLEQVDNSEVTAERPERQGRAAATGSGSETEDPDEIVRVSIVLDQPSTIAAGYSTIGIMDNASAMSYRAGLREEQGDVESAIERSVLNGADLDVVWNLTLAANIISANVRRGDIEKIARIYGVREVEEETRYSPDVISIGGELEPNMAVSADMNGTPTVWESGYTGAGTTIAIIDTGLDTAHQSFDPGAFDYAIAEMEKRTGRTYDLMDAQDIAKVLPELNISSSGVTAEQLYRSTKVPFGYNYIDKGLDITHENDYEGEHGSHVAGIAAANRYVDTDGDKVYEDALSTVMVSGNAPDAQLIIMKVFGKAGGAYDSDYMAAIEDAIALGADAVNLSLGSSYPGFAVSDVYQDVMDSLADSDTVVAISSGNNSYWAQNTVGVYMDGVGKLYNDGVNYNTGGQPGTFANAFTVASVDNDGMVSTSVGIDGKLFAYSDGSNARQPALATLDPSGEGTALPFVMLSTDSAGYEDWDFAQIADVVRGKVAITWRGGTNFSVKAQAACDAGAAAVLVANNVPGVFGMDLSAGDDGTPGYEGDIPAASISQEAGLQLWETFQDTEAVFDDTIRYITGTITINGSLGVVNYDSSHYTMSSFSSWGVPGNLTLKPEITAPGGNIYSVFGYNRYMDENFEESYLGGHDAYELMSGTSMSSPQIAGLSALVQQYLREQNISVENMTSRALTQSLLMSTAVAMTDEQDRYYPVIQQGAGLANVAAAATTPVTITVPGQNDGKVKAELGDDPERDGRYNVQFYLNNLTGQDLTYDLDASVFTQEYYYDEENTYEEYLLTSTRPMDALVTFSGGSRVIVPANGRVAVTAEIVLTEEERATLAEQNPVGAYVEAFLFAKPVSTAEGVAYPTLSIPVLGYYGSWSEPSMYEVSSIQEFDAGTDERFPYLYDAHADYNYNFLSYRIGDGNDEPAFYGSYNGLSTVSEQRLYAYRYSLIRNAGGGIIRITDAKTGKLYYQSEDLGRQQSAFFYYFGWSNTDLMARIKWDMRDTDGSILPTGTELKVSLIMAPEYYARGDGSYDWAALTDGSADNGELQDGAYLTTTIVVDNDAPAIKRAWYEGEGSDRTISVEAQDNRYVSEVYLYADDGAVLAHFVYPESEEMGETCTVVFDGYYGDDDGDPWTPRVRIGDLTDGVYLLQVWDDCYNVSTYRIFVNVDPISTVKDVTISESEIELLVRNSFQLTAQANPNELTDRGVVWSSGNPAVAAVDETGLVTGISRGTAVITAASVLDGTKTASCVVNVYPVNVNVDGVLWDSAGDARFYTWDIGSGELSILDSVSPNPIAIAAVEGTNNFYLFDYNGGMYLMDGSTGQPLEGPWVWPMNGYDLYPWDMTYVDGSLFYCNQWYLIGPGDPKEPFNGGFSFEDEMPFFMGLTSIKQDWEQEEDGVLYSGDIILYAIDDYGQVWEFLLFTTTDAYGETSYGVLYDVVASDLSVAVIGSEPPFCSLVLGDDGALYYSIMVEDVSELYRLVYDEETESYEATVLGDFGEGILPGLLLHANHLRCDFDGNGRVDADDAQLLLDHVIKEAALVDCAGDADVDGDGNIDTHDVHALLSLLTSGEVEKEDSVLHIPEHVKLATAAQFGQTGGETDNDGAPQEPESSPETEQSAEPALYAKHAVTGGSLQSVTADAAVVAANGSATVPVMVTRSSNGEFTLTYDSARMSLVQVVADSSLLTSIETDAEKGVVHVGYAAAAERDTTVVTLYFSYYTTASASNTNLTLSVVEDGAQSAATNPDLYPIVSEYTIILPGVTPSTPSTPPAHDTPTDPSPAEPEVDFSDVAPTDWFAEAVERVAKDGLMTGLPGGKFAPNDFVDRSMMAMIVYRLAGCPSTSETESKFTDVPEGRWYTEAVNWAAENNVMDGYGDGKFGPTDRVTREQMARTLWNFARHAGYDVRANGFVMPEFVDIDQVDSWAAEAMSWAVRVGLIQGRGRNQLVPTGTATRAEVATILARFLDIPKDNDLVNK